LHAGAAKAEQGAHQGGQGQLAAAGEGVGVVGAAGQLGKARAVQVVTQVGQKILCKFTVLRQNSCQPQKKIKQNQGLTDYSSLSSVDWLKGCPRAAFTFYPGEFCKLDLQNGYKWI
jgi:hypothetical protein